MGFLQAAVLTSTSFFLGVLVICSNIDYRILRLTNTTESLASAYTFYATFYNAPPAVKTMLHSVMGLGVIGLCGKLSKWDESAMFFDGSSLAAFVFGITIYITVTLPGLERVVVNPISEQEVTEKAEALRVMCAGNVLIAICLVGVLALQAGQEYARRLEAKELKKFLEQEARDQETRESKKE